MTYTYVLLDDCEAPVIKYGDNWGVWVLGFFNGAPHLEMQAAGCDYWIDLSQMNSSSEMLDWIFQLANKTWATRGIIADLVHALNDIFKPQITLCGWGCANSLDAAEFLTRRIKGERISAHH